MSTAPAASTKTWQPNDKWLLGIVLAVINFWLFAQTLLNVIPGIRGQLGVEETLANLAVSITSLFSGIFVVVAGDWLTGWAGRRSFTPGCGFPSSVPWSSR